jgi:hypothetical protein
VQEYHKIQSIYKRDERTHKFLEGDWSLPEFEYLKDNEWEFTEKVDGTNVRVGWDGAVVRFGGRTDDAQMPAFLLSRLQELFPAEKMAGLYPETPMVLYGEGYGARIQKGGGNYKSGGVDFVLFDVLIGDLWLERCNVNDIAQTIGVGFAPVVGAGTITDAIAMVRGGLQSKWGDFHAEGLVIRPKVELRSRRGHRIISKLKERDF